MGSCRTERHSDARSSISSGGAAIPPDGPRYRRKIGASPAELP
jgi:hypothetical protein